MASRLNASEAAAMTAARAKEIEAQAKQEELDRRLSIAQSMRYTRLWNSQASRLVESALNRELQLRFTSTLVGARTLIGNGFSIFYVDMASFMRQEKKLNEEKEQISRMRAAKAESQKFIVKREIEEFIRLIRLNDRFKGMTVTKENFVRQLRDKIKDYQDDIESIKCDPDKLFDHIFDGALFLFTPIHSLRPNVQALQNALHIFESLVRDLPEDKYAEDSDDDSEDFLGKAEDALNSFKIGLKAGDCRDSMDVVNVNDFYLVEWRDYEGSTELDFSDLISAPGLGWLSGDNGQELIELIESKIRSAIQSAYTTIRLVIEREDLHWSCDLGESRKIRTPHPDQLSQIFKTLKYKVKSSSADKKITSLYLSW